MTYGVIGNTADFGSVILDSNSSRSVIMSHKKLPFIHTKFNESTQKFDKLDVKAPKGKRKVAINQHNQIVIYDDKGNVVAVKQ